MSAQIIDGRACAQRLKAEVALEAKQLREEGPAALQPGLATVTMGPTYSAVAYERRLRRLAAELDVPYDRYDVAEVVPGVGVPGVGAADDGAGETSQHRLIDQIEALNRDPAITGILVLRPLPASVSEAAVFRVLSPLKDIEAVHPENAGLLALGTPRYVPSTAASVFHLLDSWLDDAGEDRADFYHRSLIVVVGRSNNVGKPAISLAYDRQATVESVDEWASRTGNLGRHTRRADVLVVAAGRPGLIKAEHVHDGAVVIDVGINPVTDPATGETHMVGDVDFASVAPRVRAITPVPGGVGPVTDVWLIRNTVTAARNLAGTSTLAHPSTPAHGARS